MNKFEAEIIAEALRAVSPAAASAAAGQVLAECEEPLLRGTATSREMEELASAIAGTLLVVRDRALHNISHEWGSDIPEALLEGPAILAVEMLSTDAEPEVECQIICRSLILRSQGRGTEDMQWESEADRDAIAFENAFDEGISMAACLIQDAAARLFAEAASCCGRVGERVFVDIPE